MWQGPVIGSTCVRRADRWQATRSEASTALFQARHYRAHRFCRRLGDHYWDAPALVEPPAGVFVGSAPAAGQRGHWLFYHIAHAKLYQRSNPASDRDYPVSRRGDDKIASKPDAGADDDVAVFVGERKF